MEKILELLNEYEPYIASDGEHRDNLWGYAYQGHSAIFPKELAESYIVSARYGFVKWLVENDKIDRDNARLRKSLWETDTSDIDEIIYTIKNSDYHYVMREAPYEAEETLLMLLSISDTPIEDLLLYLK